MTWGASFVVVAIVIGGLMEVVVRRQLGQKLGLDKRIWFKNGVLPVLPLVMGVGATFIPGVFSEFERGLAVLIGLAAGLAAGFVYDRFRDAWKAGVLDKHVGG